MKSFNNILLVLPVLAATSIASPAPLKGPPVQSNQFRHVLTPSALLRHAGKLQSFAEQDPQNNRAFGGIGHRLTVDYIYNALSSLDYYRVYRQEFQYLYVTGGSKFESEGMSFTSEYLYYSPDSKGPITAELVAVADMGCKLSDFPANVTGKIALISRGICRYGQKIALAGASGAAGALIYNNVEESHFSGSLGVTERPEGPYVPAASISQADGLSLLADIAAGKVVGTLTINAIMENRTTHNVFAQTRYGNQSNVVMAGAHTDSVGEGPGINDNGSGAMGLLEIALQLPQWSVTNAVRFGFFSAEEFGLIGSETYVNRLSEQEKDSIVLYLNFDMIASLNFGYFVYDGDGMSEFNTSAPAGSGKITRLLVEYFSGVGIRTALEPFDGCSDYGPFLDAGIPSGGITTGADGNKTVAQFELWGGQVGKWYDPGYHMASDTIKNLNVGTWIQSVKAAAHAIATYARSTEGIPKRNPHRVKRAIVQKRLEHNHHHRHGCSHPLEVF